MILVKKRLLKETIASRYFRIVVRIKDRGQKIEDRGQRTEDRGKRTEDSGQRTENRKQKTEDSFFLAGKAKLIFLSYFFLNSFPVFI